MTAMLLDHRLDSARYHCINAQKALQSYNEIDGIDVYFLELSYMSCCFFLSKQTIVCHFSILMQNAFPLLLAPWRGFLRAFNTDTRLQYVNHTILNVPENTCFSRAVFAGRLRDMYHEIFNRSNPLQWKTRQRRNFDPVLRQI